MVPRGESNPILDIILYTFWDLCVAQQYAMDFPCVPIKKCHEISRDIFVTGHRLVIVFFCYF